MYLVYFIYLIFGLAPSIIWLLFFLRKDAHPESNRMIILVFLLGVAIAPLAAIVECMPKGFDLQGNLQCFSSWIFEVLFSSPWGIIAGIFIGVALIEEFAKYLVVRIKVLKSPELDEPLDVMLYMIISALGFAALENVLYLRSPEIHALTDINFPIFIQTAFFISLIRFVGPVFLHALCSGTLGYFLAKSFYEPKQKVRLILAGFILAVLLHGLFNFSMINIGNSMKETADGRLIIVNYQLLYLSCSSIIIILMGLAVFVTIGFRKLKKMSSICLPDLPYKTQGQKRK